MAVHADSEAKLRRRVYADGEYVWPRRAQKAKVLAEWIDQLFPGRTGLRVVDFGCADGAVPVLLLRSSVGARIAELTGITLLDYNPLPDKPAHQHPRFRRLVADLEQPIDHLRLDVGEYDLVTATGFFHYLRRPEAAFAHARALLSETGYLLMTAPARWLLWLRQRSIPGLHEPNTRIRHRVSPAAWEQLAGTCGFRAIHRQGVQWAGTASTVGVERWLRRHRLLSSLAGSYLLVLSPTRQTRYGDGARHGEAV